MSLRHAVFAGRITGTAKYGMFVELDDIFVEEDARGIGVGELMMGELVSWCRDQGCFGIDVMALPGHRAAKNFFEESGFTARQIVMHHRLGGP